MQESRPEESGGLVGVEATGTFAMETIHVSLETAAIAEVASEAFTLRVVLQVEHGIGGVGDADGCDDGGGGDDDVFFHGVFVF